MAQETAVIHEAPKNSRTLSINFCIAVRVRGEFSAEGLQVALDCIRGRHKLLFSNDDAQIPLRCLTRNDEDAWKDAVKEELGRSFLNSNGAFARLTWLEAKDYSDLIGTFHHGVCDGFSGIYVMRDLLQALGNPSVLLSPFAAPPHISTLIPRSVKESPSVKRKLRMIVTMTRLNLWVSRFRRRFVSKPRQAPAPKSESTLGVVPPNLRMCILTNTLTASQTDQLVQRSKNEGTTVHAAVCTAWLRAFADSLPAKATRVRTVSSPVTLRNRLSKKIDETSGIFQSGVETSLNCKRGRDFWETAREFQTRLKRDATDENLFIMPLMFGEFSKAFSEADMGEIAGLFFGSPVKYDFSITNLGRLDFPTQVGSLKIESVRNLVNSSEHERTVNVNTFDGKITFTFMFRESKMTPEEGERLMSQALRELEMALS